APAVPHSLRIGRDLHPRLDLARARGDEHARALQLHHADTADVDRREVFELAKGRRVDLQSPARVEDGRTFRHLDIATIDRDADEPLWHSHEDGLSHSTPS